MKKFNLYKTIQYTTLLPAFLCSSITAGLAISAPAFSADSTVQVTPTSGSTRYITDTTQVALRRGPGYKYKIIRLIKSGTAVQVLEVDSSGWMRVEYKTKNKTFEGWMPASTLQNQPIAKVRLAQQVAKNDRLEAKNNQLKRELAALSKRHKETTKALKAVQQEKFKLDKAYQELKEKSAHAIELDNENKQLKQRLKEDETQLVLYKEQLAEAEDTVKRQWFLTGAGVLLLGIILGRLFRLPQKRQKWNSL